MHKIDYSYPLPEEKLIARFKPVFEKLDKHKSVTLVALPFTGRTSNLRLIYNNKDILQKLGLSLKRRKVCFVDIDKTIATYESFLEEIIESLQGRNVPKETKGDIYLLNKFLFKTIQKLTSEIEIVLILTLNYKVLGFSNVLDQIIVLAQKSVSKFPLNILWSIDTEVYKEYNKRHPSSTFGQNIVLFPTFDKEETIHSIKRILLSQSLKEDVQVEENYFEITGGIAGLFHSFVSAPQKDVVWESELIQNILKKLSFELKKNTDLIPKLTFKKTVDLINNKVTKTTLFKSIKLISDPTAQEINILNYLWNNIEKPISRDDIAQVMWGKTISTKYSDWAIDKTISRLRKKIKEDNVKILTVKNFGYQLIKYT